MEANVKRSRGRPRNLANRDALLATGKHLLLEKGLGVSVDAIVAKAGVAKATFYAYFADKEAFIEAVLLHESERTVTNDQLQAAASLPLRQALTEFGVRLLDFANEHQLIKWDRLIASASDIYPELAARMYAAGPGRGYRVLANMLAHGMHTGELKSCDPELAAGDLAGLWYGVKVLEVNLKARTPMTPAEIAQRAERGVALFLQLYGA